LRIVRLRTFFLLACASLLLAGCIDVFFDPADPDDDVIVEPPPPTSKARERFINEVYPILSVRCGACHGAGSPPPLAFVGRDPVEGYTRILTFPDLLGGFLPSAPLVNIPSPLHPGVFYSGTEQSTVLAWLEAELAERGGPPGSGVEAAIQTWSGCLDFTDFTATNMAPAFNALTSSAGQCASCHANGTSGIIINPDPQQFFQIMTTRRAFLLGYFSVDISGGTAAARMIPNVLRFQSVGSQVPPNNLHPAFAFELSPAMKALGDLHVRTELRRQAAACAPPRLVD
jgi:hypothetical protein